MFQYTYGRVNNPIAQNKLEITSGSDAITLIIVVTYHRSKNFIITFRDSEWSVDPILIEAS